MHEHASLKQHAQFAAAIDRIQTDIRELKRATRPYVTKRISNKLQSAVDLLGIFRYRLDYLMRRDHPELGGDWQGPYYDSGGGGEIYTTDGGRD